VFILPTQNRDYSGGSVPDFPRLNGDHRVPYTWTSSLIEFDFI
jgi:hypothetical protein